MPRYVVLRHECPPGSERPSHWDLMLDAGDVLRTWALGESPDSGGVRPAERLADHRREYLTYEGPISGGRGSVSRWDEGTFREVSTETNAGTIDFDLEGNRLRGRGCLACDGERWTFEYRPSESRLV